MVPDNVAWTSNTSTNLGRRFKVTRRAAAARGSYWMESIECNGTVVWDDDPSYVVCRNARAPARDRHYK
ncbi:hypothetical protein MCOR25_001796 [Pyricularia grisea]|nr:hypothetical protein MCOR25_001796 [Pyricularia grisea]